MAEIKERDILSATLSENVFTQARILSLCSHDLLPYLFFTFNFLTNLPSATIFRSLLESSIEATFRILAPYSKNLIFFVISYISARFPKLRHPHCSRKFTENKSWIPSQIPFYDWKTHPYWKSYLPPAWRKSKKSYNKIIISPLRLVA